MARVPVSPGNFWPAYDLRDPFTSAVDAPAALRPTESREDGT